MTRPAHTSFSCKQWVNIHKAAAGQGLIVGSVGFRHCRCAKECRALHTLVMGGDKQHTHACVALMVLAGWLADWPFRGPEGCQVLVMQALWAQFADAVLTRCHTYYLHACKM